VQLLPTFDLERRACARRWLLRLPRVTQWVAE
jgi:hypothetical protein